MGDYKYEYMVTYTVAVPVTVLSSGGRRAADTVAHTAVAKGLLRVRPEDLGSVKVEHVMSCPAPSQDEVTGGVNVFRDSGEEVRDDEL